MKIYPKIKHKVLFQAASGNAVPKSVLGATRVINVTLIWMQVISPNAISPKNLVESFRLKKLGEMTKRE